MDNIHEFVIFKKKITVTNINTGESYFFPFKQQFFSGNFEVRNPINNCVYTIHSTEKFLGLFGKNQFTIVGDDLDLLITYKQSLVSFKHELHDYKNHISVIYLDDRYCVNKSGVQIGKMEIISKFDPVFAISKLIFSIHLTNDSLDIKNYIFYSLCFMILMSSDSSN